MTFTKAELAKCAAREVALRKAVYAKRGMTPEREKEIAMMEQIAAQLAADCTAGWPMDPRGTTFDPED